MLLRPYVLRCTIRIVSFSPPPSSFASQLPSSALSPGLSSVQADDARAVYFGFRAIVPKAHAAIRVNAGSWPVSLQTSLPRPGLCLTNIFFPPPFHPPAQTLRYVEPKRRVCRPLRRPGERVQCSGERKVQRSVEGSAKTAQQLGTWGSLETD